jgi:hypothetical protein
MTIRPYRPAAAVFAAAVAFGLTGCGGDDCVLKGKVTYQGKPVVYGAVIVVGPDGLRRKGGLRDDGSYEIDKLPRGLCKISVHSPEPRDRNALPPEMRRPPNGPAGAPADLPPIDKSKWMELPDQYADPDASGVTTTINGGENHFDIELK